MKKASEVLFLVGKIVSFVVAGILILTAVAHLVVGIAYADEIVNSTANAGANLDEAILIVRVTFVTLGTIFIIWGILAIINGFISGLALKEPSQKNLVINIVFGILSCVEINLVGAIFGLIANGKEKESKQLDL